MNPVPAAIVVLAFTTTLSLNVWDALVPTALYVTRPADDTEISKRLLVSYFRTAWIAPVLTTSSASVVDPALMVVFIPMVASVVQLSIREALPLTPRTTIPGVSKYNPLLVSFAKP